MNGPYDQDAEADHAAAFGKVAIDRNALRVLTSHASQSRMASPNPSAVEEAVAEAVAALGGRT